LGIRISLFRSAFDGIKILRLNQQSKTECDQTRASAYDSKHFYSPDDPERIDILPRISPVGTMTISSQGECLSAFRNGAKVGAFAFRSDEIDARYIISTIHRHRSVLFAVRHRHLDPQGFTLAAIDIMFFEHFVRINDPANPDAPLLSRAERWRGLWQRVENPQLFLPGLTACTILAREDDALSRQLEFGNALIFDRVRYVEGEWLRFDVAAGEEHAGGALVITLEEPEPGCLSLSFVYHTTLELSGADAEYAEYVKSAYRDSDLETVRIIRLLASGNDQPV